MYSNIYGAAPGRQVHRKRPRLAQSFPYKTGTGDSIGLAASKPSWHANKTLVVAGIDKRFLENKDGIIEKIGVIAGRTITIHHMEVLSKEINDWLTVAIELPEEDFNHLLELDTWESGIRIRTFVGRRFWRQNRISKQTRQSSLRMQWK